MVEPHRRLGFTDLLSAPGGSIATGQSALVSLSGLPRREAIVKAPVALHLHVAPPSEPGAGGPNRPDTPAQPPVQGRRRPGAGGDAAVENPYPRVLMGAVAHLRQAMADAEHQQRLLDEDRDGAGAGPPYDPALSGPSGPPGRRRCRSGGRPTRATRSIAASTWPRSSAPAR